MSEQKKADLDSETIMMTLDQIDQTIEIMTSVVGRLRSYVDKQVVLPGKDNNAKFTDGDHFSNDLELSQTLH